MIANIMLTTMAKKINAILDAEQEANMDYERGMAKDM